MCLLRRADTGESVVKYEIAFTEQRLEVWQCWWCGNRFAIVSPDLRSYLADRVG